MEWQQETKYSVELLIRYYSPTTSAMPDPRCRKISDRIPIVADKNASMKRICIALPRCNLAGKALERIFNAIWWWGWGVGKPGVTREG